MRGAPWLLAGALLSGCEREDIQVYRVAREQPASMPAGHPDVGQPAASEPAMPKLSWKLPAGWEELQPGEMRAASFRVKATNGQADVGVFALPGMAGSDLSNVNRWRSQVGQPPVSEEEMAKLAQPVQIDGQKALLFDQGGTNTSSGDPTRVLAAVVRREGVAWFFKMTGDDQLVATQKSAFVGFLESFTFGSPSAPSAVASLPPGHPPTDGAATTTAPASTEGRPKWSIPSGWKEVAGGQFLVAKFQLAGEGDAQAAVNVSMSAGDGGGLAGNVNRWRGQLGLSPLGPDELATQVVNVDTPAGKAMFVEMSGTDARSGQKSYLLGAVVPGDGRTWFYKLMGHEQVVEREKAAFKQFVTTAVY